MIEDRARELLAEIGAHAEEIRWQLDRQTEAETRVLQRALTERARYRASERRLQSENRKLRAQLAAVDSILNFPGVKIALLKALNPFVGVKDDAGARGETLRTLMSACERIERQR
jgi:hypothetical protein